MTALRLVTSRRFVRCLNRCGSDPIEVRDRPQNFAAMSEQNAEVLEILLRQIADDREVNGVVGEALGVLGQAELFEPVRDLLHRDSASYSPPLIVGLLHLQPAKEWHHVHPPIGGQHGCACPSVRCPSWLRGGHPAMSPRCPNYPQKRS